MGNYCNKGMWPPYLVLKNESYPAKGDNLPILRRLEANELQ
jgi:hypothetical protein